MRTFIKRCTNFIDNLNWKGKLSLLFILATLIATFSVETNKKIDLGGNIDSSIEYKYWGIVKFKRNYYSSGELKTLERLSREQNRKYLEYYKSGNMKLRGNYVNQSGLHGEVESYYENGDLKFKKNFQRGISTEDIYLSEGFKKLNLLISKRYVNFYSEVEPSIRNITINKETKEVEVDFQQKKKEIFAYDDENILLKRELYDEEGELVYLKEYYENESLKLIYKKLCSRYEEYYKSGSLKVKGSLDANFKSGRFTIYNNTGEVVSKERYGSYPFSYYKNGNLKSVSLEDEEISFYENGNIKRSRYISPGGDWGQSFYRKDGTKIISEGFSRYTDEVKYRYKYYDNGELKSAYERGYGKGYKEYYENGNLKLSVKRYSKKNDVVEGYNEDETLKYAGEYKNKKRNGLYKSYFRNGNIKLEGFYKKGKKEGAFKEYSPEGELITVSEYKGDKRI